MLFKCLLFLAICDSKSNFNQNLKKKIFTSKTRASQVLHVQRRIIDRIEQVRNHAYKMNAIRLSRLRYQAYLRTGLEYNREIEEGQVREQEKEISDRNREREREDSNYLKEQADENILKEHLYASEVTGEEISGTEVSREVGYAELIVYSGSGGSLGKNSVFYEEDLIEESNYEQNDPYDQYETGSGWNK